MPSSSSPLVRPWPRDRSGVLAMAQTWSDPERVAVNVEAVAELAPRTIQAPPSGAMGQPVTGKGWDDLPEAFELRLALNTINHMFWSHDAQGDLVRYAWGSEVGAMGMCAAFQAGWDDPHSTLGQARHEGRPLSVADITRTFGDIPDPEGRRCILNEVLLSPRLGAWGQVLTDEVIRHASKKDGPVLFSTQLAACLADDFPMGYGDLVLKKAQLAVSQMWREAAVRGFDQGCELTAFADYQIPNVLRAMGLLMYDESLAERVDAGVLIPADSDDERAIRGASILAVEALATQQGVSVADVDYWLWLRRKVPTTPFHLTLTTAY